MIKNFHIILLIFESRSKDIFQTGSHGQQPPLRLSLNDQPVPGANLHANALLNERQRLQDHANPGHTGNGPILTELTAR